MGMNAQGFGLPYPSTPFPVTATSLNTPNVNGTNEITLAPGQAAMLPAGYLMVDPGQYSWIQYLDPVAGIWRSVSTQDERGCKFVNSDGFNHRVVNPTGCVVGVLVTGGGAGYSASSPPAVTFSSGAAVATAVVGGAIGTLSLSPSTSLTVTSGAGGGFTFPPIVSIAAPPVGGIQATATALLSGTAINGFTIINQGGGYTAAPAVRVIPHPQDPATSINPASVVAALTGATSVVGVLVTNYGNGVLGGVPSVTIAAPAAGTQATGRCIVALTATSAVIGSAAGGSGFGNPTAISSIGGMYSGGAFTQPFITTSLFVPRQATFQAAVSTGASGGSVTAEGQQVIDGGLFQNSSVTGLVWNNGTQSASAPTVTFSLGAVNDTIMVQQIGGNG